MICLKYASENRETSLGFQMLFLCIRCIMKKNILTLKGGVKMDAIVNRLAEIESAAAAIVKHAEEEKDELEQEMRQKQKKFDEELKSLTEQRLTEVSKQAESQISAEKERLKRIQESKILQMKKEYEQSGEQYAREILERISGV